MDFSQEHTFKFDNQNLTQNYTCTYYAKISNDAYRQIDELHVDIDLTTISNVDVEIYAYDDIEDRFEFKTAMTQNKKHSFAISRNVHVYITVMPNGIDASAVIHLQTEDPIEGWEISIVSINLLLISALIILCIIAYIYLKRTERNNDGIVDGASVNAGQTNQHNSIDYVQNREENNGLNDVDAFIPNVINETENGIEISPSQNNRNGCIIRNSSSNSTPNSPNRL